MSREGSDSEVDLANADVHFTTESGLNSDIATWPLSATSCRRQLHLQPQIPIGRWRSSNGGLIVRNG